jgi:hypothetical protein
VYHSHHERKVQILVDKADVDRAILTGAGDVEKDKARPQEVADVDDAATPLSLEVPDNAWCVLRDGVEEVNGRVQLCLCRGMSMERAVTSFNIHAREVASWAERMQVGDESSFAA